MGHKKSPHHNKQKEKRSTQVNQEMDIQNALAPIRSKLDTISQDIRRIKTEISGIQTAISNLKASLVIKLKVH